MSTLTYLAAWRPISARIKGLERAAVVHAGFLAAHNKTAYGADKDLQRHCEEIQKTVEQFHDTFRNLLPATTIAAIDRFKGDAGKQINDNTGGDALLVRTIIVKLVAFESEMSYSLDSPMERVHSASELAFMHLQRLIVVDEDYRKKWQTAFDAGETHCEKFGGVHLLWHGIWAFKVNSVGGATDLVYPEPLATGSTPVALGMVLTEWKKTDNEPTAAYETAMRQAELYSGGVLAGLELASHLYLVVVTKKQFTPPQDVTKNAVIYRHINIAIEPEFDSVAAKRLAAAELKARRAETGLGRRLINQENGGEEVPGEPV
jgi:hypothetical protein